MRDSFGMRVGWHSVRLLLHTFASPCSLGKGVSERMLFFVHIMMEPKRSGKGFDRVSTLFKWSLDNGKPVKHRQIATSAATAFAISDDGKFLGYGTSDGHMGVLNAVTMKRVTGERMFQWPVTAVAFTADGKFMFGTCGSECKALSTRRKLKGR